MKKIINIHDAKTHLSKLIERVSHGEEIIISRSGKPVAKLTAFDVEAAPRRPGTWAGKVVIAKDFDSLPTRLRKLFRGEAA